MKSRERRMQEIINWLWSAGAQSEGSEFTMRQIADGVGLKPTVYIREMLNDLVAQKVLFARQDDESPLTIKPYLYRVNYEFDFQKKRVDWKRATRDFKSQINSLAVAG